MPTIPSVPASWNSNTLFDGPQSLTFAIPAGTWVSGEWIIGGGVSGKIDNIHIVTLPSASDVIWPSMDTTPKAATPGQMTDINSAAGGTLTTHETYDGFINLPNCTLTLTLFGAESSRRRADIYEY